MKGIYFISGIDTDTGKTFATGYLARRLLREGVKAITQKLVQTGNREVSEDIIVHRKIMGIAPVAEDTAGLTCPVIFSYPASPHLASRLDGRETDLERIEAATVALAGRYEVVLLEGAGGLMVPLTPTLLTIDYIAQHGYPVILVTSGKLGSINHTLLSLEALQRRNISLYSIIYNHWPAGDSVIGHDTRRVIREAGRKLYPDAIFEELPLLNI